MTIFGLKILAVITMIIDHVGYFYKNTPVFLNWIGRLSAPIFMFCSIEAYFHTRNKKNYFKNLYILNLVMGFITVFLRGKEFNFIRVLLNLIFIIFLIETFKKDYIKFKKYARTYVLYQLFSLMVILILNNYTSNIEYNKARYLISLLEILPSLLGSIFIIEEGFPMILIGLSMYIFKDNKLKLFISYLIIISLNTYIVSSGILSSISVRIGILVGSTIRSIYDIFLFSIGYDSILLKLNIFTKYYQWMSIFSLIFIFLYNGEKGKPYKKFFYIIYPLHIIILAIISNSNTLIR